MPPRNPGSGRPKTQRPSGAGSVQVSRGLPRDSPHPGPTPPGHTGFLHTPSASHPSSKGRFNLKKPRLPPGFRGICPMAKQLTGTDSRGAGDFEVQVISQGSSLIIGSGQMISSPPTVGISDKRAAAVKR